MLAGPQLLISCFSQAGGVSATTCGGGVAEGCSVLVGPAVSSITSVEPGVGVEFWMGLGVIPTAGGGSGVGTPLTGLMMPRTYAIAKSNRQAARCWTAGSRYTSRAVIVKMTAIRSAAVQFLLTMGRILSPTPYLFVSVS